MIIDPNKREQVLLLMKDKDKIEDEIKQLTAILEQNGVGMNTPLVDPEGFPISSIDTYQVRHARHRIICLQNDHKSLMKQIENGLQSYYSSTSNHTNGVSDVEMEEVSGASRVVYETAFAKVTVVSPGSPAELAGLHVNDEVVEFGSVNSTNFKNMADIAAVVQHSEGGSVRVKLNRSGRTVPTQLVPKRWQGRGLLGCVIEPL